MKNDFVTRAERLELPPELCRSIVEEMELSCDCHIGQYWGDHGPEFGLHDKPVEAELFLTHDGHRYVVTACGWCRVEVNDESFTHHFGTEQRYGCHPTGISHIESVKAYDIDTDREYEIDLNY